jgi:hypothetical protein
LNLLVFPHQVFLLELSRVVYQLENEKNYHIFGLITDAQADRRTLQAVMDAMQHIGLSDKDIGDVLEVCFAFFSDHTCQSPSFD